MHAVAAAELGVREAIRDVLRRYGRGVDRRDWDLVRSCYHPDATDDHGVYRGDVDGFVAFFADQVGHWDGTSHHLLDGLIDLDGDVARCETPATAHHWSGDDDLVMGVRYLDRFESRDGDWRIARRTVVLEWVTTVPRELPGWPPAASFVAARPGPDDPSYDPDRR